MIEVDELNLIILMISMIIVGYVVGWIVGYVRGKSKGIQELHDAVIEDMA